MSLLTLEEAANICRYDNPESFRQAVHRLGLPVIKMGKRLLFDKTDLINHLKSHHNVHAKDEKGGNKEESKCHSSNVMEFGTLALPPQAESEYANLLKLKTSSKRKSI